MTLGGDQRPQSQQPLPRSPFRPGDLPPRLLQPESGASGSGDRCGDAATSLLRSWRGCAGGAAPGGAAGG